VKKVRFLIILLVTFAILFTGCESDEVKAEKTIKGFLTTLCTTNYEDVSKIYKDTNSTRAFYPNYFLEQLNKNFKQYLSIDIVKSDLPEYRRFILEQSNIQKISIKVDKITVEKYTSEEDKVVYNYTLNASYVKPSKEKVTTETQGQLTLEKVDNEWKICFINEFNYPFKDFENPY